MCGRVCVCVCLVDVDVCVFSKCARVCVCMCVCACLCDIFIATYCCLFFSYFANFKQQIPMLKNQSLNLTKGRAAYILYLKRRLTYLKGKQGVKGNNERITPSPFLPPVPAPVLPLAPLTDQDPTKPQPKKKGRGRPRKDFDPNSAQKMAKKKRGRPRKTPAPTIKGKGKGRGRPRKKPNSSDLPTAPNKRRRIINGSRSEDFLRRAEERMRAEKLSQPSSSTRVYKAEKSVSSKVGSSIVADLRAKIGFLTQKQLAEVVEITKKGSSKAITTVTPILYTFFNVFQIFYCAPFAAKDKDGYCVLELEGLDAATLQSLKAYTDECCSLSRKTTTLPSSQLPDIVDDSTSSDSTSSESSSTESDSGEE